MVHVNHSSTSAYKISNDDISVLHFVALESGGLSPYTCDEPQPTLERAYPTYNKQQEFENMPVPRRMIHDDDAYPHTRRTSRQTEQGNGVCMCRNTAYHGGVSV